MERDLMNLELDDIDLDDIDLDDIELTEDDLKGIEITEDDLKKFEETKDVIKESITDSDEDDEYIIDDDYIVDDDFSMDEEHDEKGKCDNSIGADISGSILKNDALLNEDDSYDKYNIASSFDDEFISDTGDLVVMTDKNSEGAFELKDIEIENIAVSKRIRKTNGVEDLVRSIRSTGLLEPIIVATTLTKDTYVLISGYRRLMACAKAGKRVIPCVINHKVCTQEIPILEALYNQSKRYSIKETIEYIDYLEKQKGIMNANMIEHLLQMNSGEYSKLKDVLNDNDEEIVSKLYDGTYSIEEAFRKLEKRRKKETAEERDTKRAEQVYGDETESGADMIVGSGEEIKESDIGLTDDEIKELAISANELGDVDSGESESLEELIDEGNKVEGFEPHVQDVHNREYIDPAIKKAVLIRDGYKCRCCGFGEIGTSSILDYHHIVPVFLSQNSTVGADTVDNGITLCLTCHRLVHEYSFGRLPIGDINEMDAETQDRFKKIIKLGTIIRKLMAKKGMKVDQVKKEHPIEGVGRRKPGAEQKSMG